MFVIGLTGGIGSGKTTVSDRFAALGVPVIDADLVAREVVEPGQPGLARVIGHFGPDLLTNEGRLDRDRLRQRVFSDPEARQALEAILHPLIRARMQERLAALRTPYAILAIPLLTETGRRDLVDRILVVDIPEAQQLERVQRRNGMDREEIRAILAAQSSRSKRLAIADDIIDNSGDLPALVAQIDRLHGEYLRLAAQHNGPS